MRTQDYSRSYADRVQRVLTSVANLQAVAAEELVDDTLWGVNDGSTLVKLYRYHSGSPAAGQCGSILATAGGYFLQHGATGVPMVNRLFCNGAAGAALGAGEFFNIGADVYEARAVQPPAGGTAGRIWFFNGANAAASRASIIKAINHTIDAPNVTYPAAGVVERFLATAAAVAATSIDIVSADAAGGNPAPSATATACGETLTAMTDIWDAANCYGGYAEEPRRSATTSVPVSVPMITQGSVQAKFDFTPNINRSFAVNKTAPANVEALTVVGNSLSMVLAGGGAPKVQPADVLVFVANG